MNEKRASHRAIIIGLTCIAIAMAAGLNSEMFSPRPDPSCKASVEECTKISETADKAQARAFQRAMLHAAQ
jgi:hypothetical protein